VALLADRNGVIDINLPISGSLNDPQFSLGSVILKVIVNLITKAITAPFTLLASAFGGSGGEELGTVPFAPGSAALSEQATAGLDKVAKVLTDRPVLIMTVTGMARLDVEREGYKRERLQALVVAEKRRAQGGRHRDGSCFGEPGPVPGTAEGGLPARRHHQAAQPGGPGQGPPGAGDGGAAAGGHPRHRRDHMRELALQRGVAVRDYLATRQLPLERLFLGAPKTTADKAPATAGAATAASGAASGPTEAAWTPRAELALTIK
jgi:hypothetical protein